jgi:hypothetical protein
MTSFIVLKGLRGRTEQAAAALAGQLRKDAAGGVLADTDRGRRSGSVAPRVEVAQPAHSPQSSGTPRANPAHGPMTTRHQHLHPSMGQADSNGDGLHLHWHEHNNDNEHAHSHRAATTKAIAYRAKADLASDPMDRKSYVALAKELETGGAL